MTEDLKLGQTVELNDGRAAVIRFVGETFFSSGIWVGVEFDDASGKNDGSVQGKRYFDCLPGHGMFLRPTGVARVLEQPQPKPPAPRQNGRPTSMVGMGRTRPTSRPSSIGSDHTVKRPGGRPSSIGSDLKGPASAIGQTKPQAPTKRPVSISGPPRRSSLVPPGNRRLSNAPATKTPTPPPPPASAPLRSMNRLSMGSGSLAARSTSTGSVASRATARPSISPNKSPTKRLSPVTASPGPSRAMLGQRAPASTPSAPLAPLKNSLQEKEIEELHTKLRVLEKKRIEDRDKLKTLERIQQERDKFEMIIQKLQAKYQPQQQENVELKRQLKDAEARLEQIEAIQAEHDTVVEMATLDREMAEEQTEAIRMEYEALKQKVEELELENEILKEENQELGEDMSPEERTSKGWLQMEKENERLRMALLRLRDFSQEQEAELKDQIKSLEEDVQELAIVKSQYDDTKARLLECEADIEDLRQQLDAALGAEEMIEELTEKNLALNEHIEELRATIDDLQSLKELNDELEINHIENEKQLQEVIDYKDSIIAEQNRRAVQQEEALSDQEYTISRFRELVSNLQSDLEDMKASKEITESQAQEMTERSKAMMDLNRQLQVSASNTKIKTIEMELRKLEAQEAAEHLAIVQLFLPEAFHSERDSVLALLRFKRIGFKARLLHGFVKDRVGGQDRHIHEDDIFEACDVLDKLTWVSAMCDRFVNSISGCSLEHFARFEGALYELEPVERALNGYIENLKRDDLRECQVADELHRSVALMTHLGDNLLGTSLESYADDVLMRTLLMQSHLETTAAALSLLKSEVNAKISITPEDEDDGLERFMQKTDTMIAHSRSAKVVVSKTVRSLQELKARNLALSADTLSSFENCEAGAEELATYVRKLGHDVYHLLHEEGRSSAFTLDEVRRAMFRTSADAFSVNETDIFSAMSNRMRHLTDQLIDLGSLTSDLGLTVEFERPPAPWVLRSKELAASKIVSIDTEEEMRRLREELVDRATLIKIRDQTLEEASVKIELLEARTRDASKKAERIKDLEKKLEERKANERNLADTITKQGKEIRDLEQEKEMWIVAAREREVVQSPTGVGGMDHGEVAVATRREMESLKVEIEVLESTNKYLREAARREKDENRRSVRLSTTWLEVPVTPTPTRPSRISRSVRAALEDLTNLPSIASPVKLTPEPDRKKRLRWRPIKESPRFQLSEQEIRRAEMWSPWNDAFYKGIMEEVGGSAALDAGKTGGLPFEGGERIDIAV